MKISCVVIDDEPYALKGIKGYVEKTPFLELKGTCSNALELNGILQHAEPDLLFLDIEMPYINGVDFIKSLRNPPKVIFITAYEKYALKGYELDVLDYMLKPVSYERFLKAAHKALDYFSLLDQGNKESGSDFFFVKCGYKIEKVLVNSVLFVESIQNYVRIHTAEESYTTKLTLKNIKNFLGEDKFIQTHKSFLVSIDKIDSIEGNSFVLGQHKVPLSKYLKAEVLEKVLTKRYLGKK